MSIDAAAGGDLVIRPSDRFGDQDKGPGGLKGLLQKIKGRNHSQPSRPETPPRDPQGPKPFSYEKWLHAHLPDDQLGRECKEMLRTKGYKRELEINLALTDESGWSNTWLYHKVGDRWVDQNGRQVEMDESETQGLEQRLGKIPADVSEAAQEEMKDNIVGRYLNLRYQVRFLTKVVSDADLARNNPEVRDILLDATFARETEGGGLVHYTMPKGR